MFGRNRTSDDTYMSKLTVDLTTRPQGLLHWKSLISFSYFEHVCNFRRVQLSITVNIRHCMRMTDFLSEADLVSINICFNQNYK